MDEADDRVNFNLNLGGWNVPVEPWVYPRFITDKTGTNWAKFEDLRSEFKVGDQVEYTGEDFPALERGSVGEVVEILNHYNSYPYRVFFENGYKDTFKKNEIQLYKEDDTSLEDWI
jgi:hypothetical protein